MSAPRAMLVFVAVTVGCGRPTPRALDTPCHLRVLAALEAGDVPALEAALQSGCSAEEPIPEAIALARVTAPRAGVPRLDAVRKAFQLNEQLTDDCDGLLGKSPSRAPGAPSSAVSVVSTPRPLHLAAFHCRSEAVSVLIRHRADPNGKDSKGLRPLHYATCSEVVAALLAVGADVEARGVRGVRPLHLAISRGVAAALLDGGATIHARDDHGNTPLHIAECLALVRIVVERPREGAGDGPSAGPDPPQKPTRLDRIGQRVERALFRVAELQARVLKAALRAFDVPGFLRSRGADPMLKNDVGIDADGIALRPGDGGLDID